MGVMNEAEIHMAVREVLRRCSIDAQFRKLATSDGTAAVEAVSSKRLPDGAQFRFLDNSGPVKSYALPDIQVPQDELTAEELEDVAGGCDIASCLMTM